MDHTVYYLLWDGCKFIMRAYQTVRSAFISKPGEVAMGLVPELLKTPNAYIVGVVVVEQVQDAGNKTVCAYYRPFAPAARAAFSPVSGDCLEAAPDAYWETHFMDTSLAAETQEFTIFKRRLNALEGCIRAIEAQQRASRSTGAPVVPCETVGAHS